ncbi:MULTISPECIES: paraquat-inducible protein A [Paraburkholderia]|jgi:paraquat-inducible protein A|uniref:Paraquat-inducible protein A n=1 Tax=Paraburkholderia madseniana TaxID=2599607 RepID=A0AAP5ELI8_9BURK|nr:MULTISPECIES: paraquat-inducible protein A [Paraburkholderia]MCX4144298.1 paraquat-inducible protein A [Paraburkholderia madseniana]MDN7147251.1 paraquat-inducible protein A [Paraburkholderia sp. WS6]MDQ6406131.1 paraquat-inducible protein A [Paraburkholderia madseniana]
MITATTNEANEAGPIPLVACHECDLLQRESAVPPDGTLRCCRCHAELYRAHPDSTDRALAFTLTCVVLFFISNLYPIVGLAVNGDLVETTLLGAVRVLYKDGMWPIAGLVLATTFLMPLMQMTAMAYLLVPLQLNRRPYHADFVFRLMHLAQPWGMTEVLILGMLVALVKLAHIASVVPGVALWSFGALMLLLAAAGSAFDPHALWRRMGSFDDAASKTEAAAAASAHTALRCGMLSCHSCGLLVKSTAHVHGAACPRCGAHLHARKPDSIARTWAFLIAAIVMYIPANALPVMNTSSLFGSEKDTIMSGVVYLWTSGSWPLAVVVFIASVAVPMLKILALIYLVISTQRRSVMLLQQRTRIYRLVELVGRWSMLDIYVITILVALVQFNALATIQAGPAAVAFGSVVVLTMFAAMSFDPRLIWDATEDHHV